MKRCLALAAVVVFGGCNLLNPGGVQCDGDADCFFGYVCDGTQCVDALPDGGLPPIDDGGPPPDGDAGQPDAGPACLPAPLLCGPDVCFTDGVEPLVYSDEFRAVQSGYCDVLPLEDDALAGDAELNLGITPGDAPVRMRVVFDWQDAEILARFNSSGFDIAGTGFHLDAEDDQTRIVVERSAEDQRTLTVEALEPGGRYFAELRHGPGATELLISRFGFLEQPLAHLVHLVRVADTGSAPAGGDRVLLRAAGEGRIQRFEIAHLRGGHPLDPVAFLDTFAIGAPGTPQWPLGAQDWAVVGSVGTSDGLLQCADCELTTSAGAPVRARVHTRRNATGTAGFYFDTFVVSQNDTTLSALGIDLGLLGPELFHELAVEAGRARYTARARSFNGPLVAHAVVFPAGLTTNDFGLVLNDAAAGFVELRSIPEVDIDAPVLFDDFENPDLADRTLIPGDRWQGNFIVAEGNFNGDATTSLSTDGGDVRARFVVAPQGALGADIAGEQFRMSVPNGTVGLEVDRTVRGGGFPDEPLFVELELGQFPPRTAIIVREGSFTGDPVAALERRTTLSAITQLRLNSPGVANVEIDELLVLDSGLLFYDTFTQNDSLRTQYPDETITQGQDLAFDNGLSSPSGTGLGNLTAREPLGYKFVLRAKIRTADTLTDTDSLRIITNFNGGFPDENLTLVVSTAGSGMTVIRNGLSDGGSGLPMVAQTTYFLEFQVDLDPGGASGDRTLIASLNDTGYGVSGVVSPGFAAFVGGPAFDVVTVEARDQIRVEFDGDDLTLQELYVERLP
jgi:hypothetical protein